MIEAICLLTVSSALLRAVVDRRKYHVLEQFDVVGVDDFGVDGDGQDLHPAGHRGRDGAAACRSLDREGRHLLLHLLHAFFGAAGPA